MIHILYLHECAKPFIPTTKGKELTDRKQQAICIFCKQTVGKWQHKERIGYIWIANEKGKEQCKPAFEHRTKAPMQGLDEAKRIGCLCNEDSYDIDWPTAPDKDCPVHLSPPINNTEL